jgi:F-box protein 25/32
MPFLGKDWRSSGDEWIKTEQGWQKTKYLQFLVHPSNIQ